jgi:hypothetical protein
VPSREVQGRQRLAACLGWAITTWILVSALKEKDRHHALHVSGLLNRIQAPQEAVVKDLVGDEPYEPVVLAAHRAFLLGRSRARPHVEDAD